MQYATDPISGRSYFSGGDDLQYLGLAGFDASNPEDLVSSNETAPQRADTDSPGFLRTGGEAVYFPYGKQGVLIFLGGLDVSSPSGPAGPTIIDTKLT